MDIILEELIELVKNASPIIWDALYRQVFVEGLSYLIWAVFLIFVAVGFVRLAKWSALKAKKIKSYLTNDFEIITMFAYAFSVISGFASFSLFVTAIKWFSNPSYYAIKILLSTLGQ